MGSNRPFFRLILVRERTIVILSQLLETPFRGGFRNRLFAAFAIVSLCTVAADAQEKRRGFAGKGEIEETSASAPDPGAQQIPGGQPAAGGQPGTTGPVSVPKFELTPRTLPGAIATPDPKLLSGAPFNTKNYFFVPPEGENAGPLVLDALSEFPEVYAIVNAADSAGLEQRRKNMKAAMDWMQANPNPRNWDPAAIEQAMGPYRVTFAKLKEAHKKPDCVIPTGISFDALLPHVQASRMIPAIAAPLIYADLARGDKAGAIDKFSDALRLGLDLQPRSTVITGLVVAGMHKTMADSVLPILLNAKGLTASDFDKILAALKNYRSGSINLLPESLKTTYLIQVKMMDDLVEPDGVDRFVTTLNAMKGGKADPKSDETVKKVMAVLFTPENVQKLKAGMSRSTKALLAAIDEIASVDDIKKIGTELDAIAKTTGGEMLAEVLDVEMITTLASVAGESNPALAEAAKKAASADQKSAATMVGSQLGLNVSAGLDPVVTSFLYFQNDQGVMEALTAIRRWYDTKKSVPKDKSLDEICKEAGLEAAPLDIFTGKPMKMTWTQSGPAVLTAGHDFTDDDGKTILPRAERAKPGAKGDLVDTLVLGGNATITNQPGSAPGAGQSSIPGAGAISPPGAGNANGEGGRKGRAEAGTSVAP
jgi:hypothetical protein